MENNTASALVKSSSALTRVSNQIAITNRLLEVADPFLIPYRKGNKWGFCDRDKRIVIECVYNSASRFEMGLAVVSEWWNMNGNSEVDVTYDYPLVSIINKRGQNLVNHHLHYAALLNENMSIVGQMYKPSVLDADRMHFGYFNHSKNTIIGNIKSLSYYARREEDLSAWPWNKVGKFSEGLAFVGVLSKTFWQSSEEYASLDLRPINYGYIDEMGQSITCGFCYDEAKDFSGGLAAVKKDGKWGYINKKGEVVLPFVCKEVESFSSGLAAIHYEDGYGFINMDGKIIISTIYLEVGKISENLVWAREKGSSKVGFLDLDENWVISPAYDYAGDFSEGLARVSTMGIYGFIDRSGVCMIDFLFQDAGSFSDGLTWVKMNNKFGFIDKNGVIIIPIIYDTQPESFQNGLSLVTKDGISFYINLAGNEYYEE